MIPAVLSRPSIREELPGLTILAIAVLFNAIFLAPELRIGKLPLNDVNFHLTVTERLAEKNTNETFLNPWISEFALGYPVLMSYQPIPHAIAALTIRIFRPLGDPPTLFAALFYLLLITFPISVYIGARLLGLPPPAAGLAAVLALATSADGNPGKFGIGYGSFVWRGSGLFTQLFALHILAISLGVTARALDYGARQKRLFASGFIALTALCHIIFGYAAFVSAALLAVAGPAKRRSERLVRLVTIAVPALAAMAWFLVPLILARDVVNHSRWEAAVKWDSYGAPFILKELFTGRLFDFGRLPFLTVLLGIGAAGAVANRKDPLAQRLLALTGLWLLLFFGRETWGHLLLLAGVPSDFHLHRLQAVFELSAILLGSYGLIHLVGLAEKRKRVWAVAGALAIEIAVLGIGVDRAAYLKQNQIWGDENLAAYQRERPDLEAALADIRSILAQRPGRVSGGMAGTWGKKFRIGSIDVYEFLSRNHIPQASFLNHTMSRPADALVMRDENDPAHDALFGIRAVIAPAGQKMPPHLAPRSVHGRFAVYESSPEGFFGLVDIAGHYTGPATFPNKMDSAWLQSPLLPRHFVVSLDPRAKLGPAIPDWDLLLPPPETPVPLEGRVITESKDGETYRARIQTNRRAYAYIKMTWSPGLVATVDGQSAPLLHVTPGFGAVAIPAGVHDVHVVYQPGILRPVLLLLGFAVLVLAWFFLDLPALRLWESRTANRFSKLGQKLATPRFVIVVVLLLSALVVLHPLFRGKLIDGHDSITYLPRLVEMKIAVSDLHIPPIWAPDLGYGHGEPVFQFLPPFLYWLALPFQAASLGLADAVQLALALQFLLGTAAVYRIGRLFEAPRFAAAGGAILWLFGPYVSFDLYVRAAFNEAGALALAPLALWTLLEAVRRPSALRVAVAAAAIAAIQLSHSAAALLLIPSLAIIAIAYGLLLLPPSRRLPSLTTGPVTIAIALGLSAWFWIPAMVETANLDVSRMMADQFSWRSNFLWLSQLIWSQWGFGLSVPGPNDDLSFDLGPAHVVLAILGIDALWRRGARGKSIALSSGLISLVGVLLTTCATYWIWEHVSLLAYFQFPWRALLVPGLFFPFLGIFALERIGYRGSLAALAVVVAINLPHTEPKAYLTFEDSGFGPSALAQKGITVGTPRNFEPRWVAQTPSYYPVPILARSGELEVTTRERRAQRQEYAVTSKSATQVEFATFYYPGWELRIDGAPAPIAPHPIRGTIQFDLPAGAHLVSLELHRTPVQRCSLYLSLVTLLLLIGAVVAERQRKPRRATAS